MKYETLVNHGIIKDSDYQNAKEFMLKNNEQNDLNNNKTNWKYFYNIGCEEINDRLYFCFVYNMKNCYYDFIYKTLKVTLSEDLKVEIAVELADLIKFLKDNNSLFEFNQSDYLQDEGDRSIFNSVLYIKH